VLQEPSANRRQATCWAGMSTYSGIWQSIPGCSFRNRLFGNGCNTLLRCAYKHMSASGYASYLVVVTGSSDDLASQNGRRLVSSRRFNLQGQNSLGGFRKALGLTINREDHAFSGFNRHCLVILI